MGDNRTGTFQVDFENLIRVLGENMYANPKAAIRELIQNASDSCVRRKVTDTFEPRIHLQMDREQRLLMVEDNGAGMAEAEVVRYLASIGGGETRNARKRLMTSNQAAAKMLIGQFGIGFLSSFVVAERVLVDTRSIQTPIPIQWDCQGTSEYQLGTGERSDPGTKVTLFLKKAHYDLLDETVLQEAIIRYADFIAFPIFLNHGATPINRMNAPWHVDAPEAEYIQYLEHRYGVPPLALEPIQVEEEGLEVSGVLFIPPRSPKFKRRLRSVDVFQTRMFVGEDLEILPDWAGFVCAVLDCPTLDLVASREAAIGERESYRRLQRFLSQAVTAFIRRLAEQERPTFLEIIKQHDWRILAGSIRNDEFFDQVKDLIPLPSDMGPVTMPKYLERIRPRLGNLKTIYYIPGEQPLGQQQSSLFKAQGVPIIQADLAVEQFLRKYVDRTEEVTLRQIASGIVELMEMVEGPQWRNLEAQYQELGITAKAVRFDPPELPGMAVRQEAYDQVRLIQQLVEGERALLDFMGHVGHQRADAYGLALNVSNPIIQHLADYEGDSVVMETALRAIYASALLSAGVELTTHLSQQIAYAQMRIIELLLEQATRIESGQTVGPYAPSLFEPPAPPEPPAMDADDEPPSMPLPPPRLPSFEQRVVQLAEDEDEDDPWSLREEEPPPPEPTDPPQADDDGFWKRFTRRFRR